MMAEKVSEISLLKHQMEFIKSKSKFAVLSGAIGSGKSHAFRISLLSRALEQHRNDLGLVTASTADQMANTVLNPLMSWLQEIGIKHGYNRTTRILNIGSARFLCASLDNPSPLRGIEVGCIFGDEAAFYREDALDIILGRLRNKYAAKSYGLIGRFATSPNGKNHFYEKFISESALLKAHVIKARIRDNIFLPDDYIESLYNAYDSRTAQAELEGEYIDGLSGNVYWAFSDKNVRNLTAPKGHTPKIGMDFNVSPMTAVVGYNTEKSLYIYDESFLEDSNTFKMCESIKNRIDEYGPAPMVYPDATGNSRRTSAFDSDHQIIRDAGFIVRSAATNPRREDRFNTVNKLLETGRLIIDKRCVKLQRDLLQVVHDKNPKHLTHISDALGYLCYGLFPLKRPKKPTSTIILD